jgi:dCMP deaminase
MRPSWDEVYMQMAHMVSRRSTCQRLQVGCLVVSMDNTRVLSLGYNGGAAGIFDDCLSQEPGKCGHLHAEINALIKLNYHDAAQKKIYVTTLPCFTCSVAIINAGIGQVNFSADYRDHSGYDLLVKAKIQIRQLVYQEL